jgi:TonB family protein
MPDTDSTRTGMRWRWCSGRGRRVLARRGALALAVAVAAACVSSTTKYYVPSAGEDRLSTDEVRERADELLRVECPRLLGGTTAATGAARLTVDVGADGAVTRARVRSSAGDQRVDDIFGALAARLQVDPPERGPRAARITMGYSCAPNEAVTTVQLNQ